MHAMESTAPNRPDVALLPGFDDPVPAAQVTFRAALEALSHPGRMVEIEAESGVPRGLSPAMTALLLALADVDTPVWLPPAWQADASVTGFLRFYCGCPLAARPCDAAFVAVPAGAAVPPLAECGQGDPAYPDRSTTLLIEVTSFVEGRPLTLRGPGIDGTTQRAVAGLPETFWGEWRANHARFPLGVDLLLTQGRQLCGLPRTTYVEV
jgi:alpha-D-ribose 1-methylphosphonate 5-triphosphate synthase subunit PhnH